MREGKKKREKAGMGCVAYNQGQNRDLHLVSRALCIKLGACITHLLLPKYVFSLANLRIIRFSLLLLKSFLA